MWVGCSVSHLVTQCDGPNVPSRTRVEVVLGPFMGD